MLEPNFDSGPTTVRIHRCGYSSPCLARGCVRLATFPGVAIFYAVLSFNLFGYGFLRRRSQ